MSIQDTLEQEFLTLLNECSRIHWKNLELELLIQYANMEKKIWEDRNLDYAVNNMIRVIEMAESLSKLREEGKRIKFLNKISKQTVCYNSAKIS